MRDLLYYQRLAQDMVQRDAQRDQMLAAMDRMWRGDWSLPPQMADLRWVHKVVSSDPHDALRAGTRVLSSVEPYIKVQPLAGDEAQRGNADKLERALSWLFRNASRRRRASVLRDVVLSALMYDEVVAQVVYLPHQVGAMQAMEGDAARLQAAQRYGPFAILVRNPRQVHVRYSDWMPEAVLMKRVMPAAEALDYWGKKAGRLKRALKERQNAEMRYITLYDYMDLEMRVVWAVPQEEGGITTPPLPDDWDGKSQAGIEMLREEHGLGFLPWVAKVGGTTLAEDPLHQRIPLLYSVYQTRQWETQNVLETLMTSEAIAYAAAPRLKVEGPTDMVEVDYGEPGRTAYVPPGHNISPMTPPQLDTSLANIADRVSERIGKSTVPRVLQSGDYPGGTAFSTLNLATQSGIKSLNPYKELAEQALADIFTQMLYWVAQDGKPLVAFGHGRSDRGQQLVLDPRDYDHQQMFIEVELTADVPTDRMARINAGAMAVRELGYSRARALEQVGESDPQEIMQQARQEEMEAVALEIEKQKELALAKVEIEQLVAQQKAEAEPAAPVTKPGGDENNGQAALQADKGIQAAIQRKLAAGGQGFNPALGGTPPVMAAPGITPEVEKGAPRGEEEK